MASTGKTAWVKYYQGKGDIETVMKKDSQAFDAQYKPTGKSVKKGEEVTVIATKEFDPKTLVRLKNNSLVRVTFDNITKPNKKSLNFISLKPQAFGIKDKQYTLPEYMRLLKDSLESRSDLTPKLRLYLQELIDNCYGKANLADLKKTFSTDLPVNDINKDFGEVIGPITIIKKQLLKDKKIKISTSAKIFVPSRPNEPLMDYSVIEGNYTYVISAKSGKTTNLVKPGDILSLINKSDKMKKKWQNTIQYKVFDVLNNESIVMGPLAAVSYMYPKLITPKAIESTKEMLSKGYNDFHYDVSGLSGFISQNEYLKTKKKPTLNEIMYECEKVIQYDSKNKLDFTDIFKDAIYNQVIYVKFELTSSGMPEWKAIVSDDLKSQSIFLRSKNGYTRKSDRMGVQT